MAASQHKPLRSLPLQPVGGVAFPIGPTSTTFFGVRDAVRQKLETLPPQPGVYVFRGRDGDEVLYVGKASSLRSRVRSYFQPSTSDARAFVARLERELSDIETFVTANEKEAALLENELIKQHQPRYNIKLRDDKDFLSLRLNPKTHWPRLEVVRRPRPDGAMYFGPYHSATAARQTLRLVNRHFQLRTCTDSEMRNRSRPCLQHQIDRCPAPCVLEVDGEGYREQVKDVALFLDGRHDELVRSLKERMRQASETLAYEQAAVHRDQLRAVERVRQSQRVATVKKVDQDIIGLHRQADHAEVAVVMVRSGKMVGVRTFAIKRVSLPDDELLSSFIAEWYRRAPVPDEVLLPRAVEAMEGLEGMLSEARESRSTNPSRRSPRVRVPMRGAQRRLIAMAEENAAHAFQEKRRAAEDLEARLEQLRTKLRLETVPRRIECIDVSHTSGKETAAAVVALADGAPDRARYRSFHVKGTSGGDDYGAMYEVLSRRYLRARAKQKGWEKPDLLVVDGGKGQLNVALAVLQELGLELPVVALAKEKESERGEKRVDRVYLPGQKNPIPVHSTPALAMLALARDEAHRVSNRLRTKLGTRQRLQSGLDAIQGIGPKTRAKLLSSLGSLEGVRSAIDDELVAAGATRRQVSAIRAALGPPRASDARANVSEAERSAVANAFSLSTPDDSEAVDE